MKRKLIVDVGAGFGEFMKKLRHRNPKKEVIGIDKYPGGEGIKRSGMGEYFHCMSKEDAERLHAVWMNHVGVTSMETHRDLVEIVKKLPPKTPIIMTIREKNLAANLASAEHAGLKVVGKKPYTEKMLGSEYTKKYFEEGKRNPDQRPYRVVLMKK